MEESSLEIILGILARLGIVTAHGFEYIAGSHTVMVVVVLWSLEELIAVKSQTKFLTKRHKGALEKVHLFGRR